MSFGLSAEEGSCNYDEEGVMKPSSFALPRPCAHPVNPILEWPRSTIRSPTAYEASKSWTMDDNDNAIQSEHLACERSNLSSRRPNLCSAARMTWSTNTNSNGWTSPRGMVHPTRTPLAVMNSWKSGLEIGLLCPRSGASGAVSGAEEE